MGSEQFRDYVTGTSFCLTLSRRMIEMISQMDAYGSTYGLMATARGLSERGLVEWAECSDSRCSPGGCRKNCADYSAGVELQLNRMPKQTKPPKSTRGRK
jgi:hypothetical protein